MKTKNSNFIITALFVLFIGGFFLLNLLIPDREFSPNENRYLQQHPGLSLSSLIDGSFTEKTDAYLSDQFPLRDQWIMIKARLELLQGRRENNGVFLCEGERLVEPFTAPDAAALKSKSDAVNTLAESVDVPVTIALIPGSAELYGDLLPYGAENCSQRKTADAIYYSVTAKSVDLAETLISHKDEYVFYRTDHHWTSLGAMYAAEKIFADAGESLPLPDAAEAVTVSESFYGTSYSSSGFFWISPDSIQKYRNAPDGLTVEKLEGPDPVSSSLYDESALETKDKYRYFLGGNSSCVHIHTTCGERPSILILRDSYADSLVPFLLESYSDIYLLDLRYYHDSVISFVNDHPVDSVLILYSVNNFVTDPGVEFMAR